jgi:serine/threonine protein kinase
MTIEAGTRIGKYEVQSLAGEGGMGLVYRALDTELRRPVALKFLPADVAADPRRLERFGREALAASPSTTRTSSPSTTSARPRTGAASSPRSSWTARRCGRI